MPCVIQSCSYISLHTMALSWNQAVVHFHMFLTWGGRKDPFPLCLRRLTGRLCCLTRSGQTCGSRERGQQHGVRGSLQTTRDQIWVMYPLRKKVTVSAHLQPAFALHLGWGYKLQAAYQYSTDRLRPKRNQRQEGTPPFWPSRLRTRLTTGGYATRLYRGKLSRFPTEVS